MFVAMQKQWALWGSTALLSLCLSSLRSDNLPIATPHTGNRLQSLPRLTIWIWERREDLRDLDPTTTAVAYLDRTLVLSRSGVTIEKRREPLLLPASPALRLIPVVRIETSKDAPLDELSVEAIVEAIIPAITPRSAALQIDFDARRSERDWYREVLRRVRQKLPPNTPLSVTALASWCSYDNAWMQGLPIDEAVPMLFRMEPDRRRAAATGALNHPEFTLREPLCMDSVGISTHERWPVELAGRRIYIFPDAGWQRDGLKETVKQLW